MAKKVRKITKLKRIDKKPQSLMKLITRLVINVIALLVVAYLLEGFVLADFRAAIVAAIVMGLVNTYLRPILQLVALPLTIVTFGIGAFLVNVLMLWLVAIIVPGFDIANFWTAALASILLSLTNWFLHKLASE